MTARRKPAKKTQAKKAAAKKVKSGKAPAAKKATAAKKPAAKKKATAKKKVSAKKVTAKKASARKKPAAKKTPTKKSTAKKGAAKKTLPASKKPAAKKAPAERGTPALADLLDNTTPELAKRRVPRRKGLATSQADEQMLWFLSVPFEDRNMAKWGGANWDYKRKRWVYRGKQLPKTLTQWAAPAHSWERWLQEDSNGFRQVQAPTADIQLRHHQEEAASAITRAYKDGLPGFLLADQVGLGKTYATIEGINQIGEGLNILVLCPLSVAHHWRRSLDAMGDGGNRWCVQNYDRAKQLLQEPQAAKEAVRTRTKNKRIAQQGRSIVAWDIVIADEAHRLKNPQSQRSAAVRQITKSHGTPAFTVWLSATAGQNPLELAYLAPLLSWRTGANARDMGDFEIWCREMGLGVKRGSFGSWMWERNEEDLHMMRRMLFDGTPAPGLRRRPEDLEGWPEMQRITWPVELDWDERKLYDEAWDEFRAQLALSPSGSNSHNALVAALRFRQKASLLRVEHTARHASELVAEGMQVAISVQFIETADAISEALQRHGIETARITGQEGANQREEERVAFQQGEKLACLFTVTEGISLHAGEQAVDATDNERALLVHDLRWSALDMAQIEGRCHRDGQNAVGYYLFADETVETRVAEAVLGRLADMGTMLGDDTVGLDALLEAVTKA